MGNSYSLQNQLINEHNIAGVRCMYPLYKTSHSTPELDYKMQKSFALQSTDEDVEKYIYRMPDEVWQKKVEKSG